MPGKTENYGPHTLGHFIWDIEPLFHSKTAVIYHRFYRRQTFTYQKLFYLCRKTASYFFQLGLKKGDHIAIYGGNCPEYLCLLGACALTGVIAVPLDRQSEPSFVDKIREKAQCQFLFTDSPQYGKTKQVISLDDLFAIVEELDPTVVERQKAYISCDDPLQIIYTSGTTQEPKGVIISNRNLVANLRSLRLSIGNLKSGTFLSFLPLSHLLEQTLGMWACLRFGGTIVYAKGKAFHEIFSLIKEEKVAGIVAVPAILELLKKRILENAKEKGFPLSSILSQLSRLPHSLRRILSYPIRKKLGSSLDLFVCGGAKLTDDAEIFWENMGLRVVQGYGLTEASPLVACNSLSCRVRGSVGRPLNEQGFRINDEGEILIAGENVTPGYYQAPELKNHYWKDGWYRTGDIAFQDDKGNVFLRGRKKSMFVGPNGLNIFPEDVESVLKEEEGILEAVLLSEEQGGDFKLLAYVTLEQEYVDLESSRQRVNSKLNAHQRIQKIIKWPHPDFPKTPSQKIKRNEVKKIHQEVEHKGKEEAPHPSSRTAEGMLSQITQLSPSSFSDDQSLGRDLGLDSLKLISLCLLVESQLGKSFDESKLRPESTVKEFKALLEACLDQDEQKGKNPQWIGSFPLRTLRTGTFWVTRHTLFKRFFQLSSAKDCPIPEEPVIFVANHNSHLDAPSILASLPPKCRRQTVVAAAADHFFEKASPMKQLAINLLLPLFPFFRFDSFKSNLKNVSNYLNQNKNIILFPEGTRSRDGSMHAFRQGIGLLVQTTRAPVIPIHLSHTFELLPPHKSWPKAGPIQVHFGSPLHFDAFSSVEEISKQLEKEVALLAPAGGIGKNRQPK